MTAGGGVTLAVAVGVGVADGAGVAAAIGVPLSARSMATAAPMAAATRATVAAMVKGSRRGSVGGLILVAGSLLAKPPRRLDGVVADDDVGAGSADGGQCLQRSGPLVEGA